MPKEVKKSGKKTPAPPPYADPKKAAPANEPTGPIWEKKPRNFAIGGDIQPKWELGRYVKWPKYVRIQRQRKILYQRLRVPPSINQFTNTLDKNLSLNLFKLLHKYRPEDAATKKERLAALAEKKDAGDAGEAAKKPLYVKYGINHITKLCEEKKAQLVCIAHDVDPIEVRARSAPTSPATAAERALPFGRGEGGGGARCQGHAGGGQSVTRGKGVVVDVCVLGCRRGGWRAAMGVSGFVGTRAAAGIGVGSLGQEQPHAA